MRIGGVRTLAAMAAGLVWLTGCAQSGGPFASGDNAATTGSLPADPASGLQGIDPGDDLALGKAHYRQGRYDRAETHFRKATERNPKSAEAWVGLAAAHDRLKRFDLADRAYAQAIGLVGATPELLNNQGYSYLLRGDHRRARDTLTTAAARDPQNPYVQNNLRLLAEAERQTASLD
jgi:Flp pilus assembly protein TadD